MSVQFYLCRQCGFLAPASEIAAHEDDCAVKLLPGSERWAKYEGEIALTPEAVPERVKEPEPQKRGKRGANSYGDTPDA
jgi:hypothetical protein